MLFYQQYPQKRRSLYYSLVRSNFEHACTIWRPTNESEMRKFDNLQKKALKWILNEQNLHYSNETYVWKCYQNKLMPMMTYFDRNDLILFHKIIKNVIPIELPYYIERYIGQGRLRRRNLNSTSYILNLKSSSSRSPIYRTFFYRALHAWNNIPNEIRDIDDINVFKIELSRHLNQETMNKELHLVPHG